jgi:hypothetical protein
MAVLTANFDISRPRETLIGPHLSILRAFGQCDQTGGKRLLKLRENSYHCGSKKVLNVKTVIRVHLLESGTKSVKKRVHGLFCH